ncbi:MAG: glutathione-disulfide reductase, partial [Gammaproteobacteria bacterium]|nr:glutathione-disulfide reductase [Gammaproteobacteria bacterium]
MSQHFDLIAIGGGSGGLAVAEKAAQLGRRVAVVETGKLGGTCVNAGCVPKKVMWYGANLATAVADAPGYGVKVQSEGIDWSTLVAGRNRYVAEINGYWDGYVEQQGITRIQGQARFVDAKTIAVGE